MAGKKKKRNKRKRRSGQSRPQPAPAKQKRVKRRGRWFLVILAVLAGLFFFDRSGPVETIPAQVVDFESRVHNPRGGESHTHRDAVLEFEGSRRSIEGAENVPRGDWVDIDIRRGRLSGRAYFEGFRGAVNPDLLQSAGEQPAPWEYDLTTNKHWDPDHAHWHDGPPPTR